MNGTMMTANGPDGTERAGRAEANAWETSGGRVERDHGQPSSQMRVVRTRSELSDALTDATMYAPGFGRRAVVMTMGALHEGHLSLIRAAREASDHLTVTIFVNPLQFGPHEDFEQYPRDLAADLTFLETSGVDLVFAPSVETMFPKGNPEVTVRAGRLGAILEGASRPGHFDGVLTIVAKLLHLTRPEMAFFGQKDAQQLAAIRRMVRDLEFHTDIRTAPIVRDDDGLALSSRNTFLSEDERGQALALPAALLAAHEAGASGSAAVLEAARTSLADQQVETDYVVLVDPESLADVSPNYEGNALLLLAARVGEIRLLDNAEIEIVNREVVVEANDASEVVGDDDRNGDESLYGRVADVIRRGAADDAGLTSPGQGDSIGDVPKRLRTSVPTKTNSKEPVVRDADVSTEAAEPAGVAVPKEAAVPDAAVPAGVAEPSDSAGPVDSPEASEAPEASEPFESVESEAPSESERPALGAVDPAWIAPTRIAPARLGRISPDRPIGQASGNEGGSALPPPTPRSGG